MTTAAADATESRKSNSEDIQIAGLLKKNHEYQGVLMEMRCLQWRSWLDTVRYGTRFEFSVWQKAVYKKAQKKKLAKTVLKTRGHRGTRPK